MKSQWECLLQNLGAWHGSFTRFSPDGKRLKDTPTIVSLTGLNGDRTLRQTIQKFAASAAALSTPVEETVLEYSTLGRNVLLFENGAFSQGSMQFSPVGEFGAELGLIWGDRRLRMVQLFEQGQLTQLTLIREKLASRPLPEQPPPTIEALIGNWQGEAITIYPDWRPPETYSTQLQIWQDAPDRLTQQLSIADGSYTLTSSATIVANRLQFEQGSQPVQILWLPDGASATCPMTIQSGQPLFLEIGWLIDSTLRQRLIRSYNDKGEWVSLTLVTERRQ